MRKTSDHSTITILKAIVFLSFFFHGVGVVLAQPPDWEWAKGIGGSGSMNGGNGYSGGEPNARSDIAVIDASGNVYSAGSFTGTVDFDPGSGTFNLTSLGEGDIYISKYDSDGDFLWTKRMGGTGDDGAYSITLDFNQNIYTTGGYSGSADFDPGTEDYFLSSAGGRDIFISKLDSSGNFLWAKSIGGSSGDWGASIQVDSEAEVYVAGSFFSSVVDFDPGNGVFNLSNFGSLDIFILKLETTGDFIWAKQIGGTGHDDCLAMTLDLTESNNIYSTGVFSGTADFDPGNGTYNLTAVDSRDNFVCKLDNSGDFVWARGFGGNGYDMAFSIAIDFAGSGDVYTTGWFLSTVDFDPGPDTYYLTAIGHEDVFILRLNESGDLVWAKQLGGTDATDGQHIILDSSGSGSVFTSGYFRETADFDPGSDVYNLTSAGGWDAFITKLDSSGNFEWALSIGGANEDVALELLFDQDGAPLLAGAFASPAVVFGSTTLTNTGGRDRFFAKLGVPVNCAIVTNTNDTGDGSLRDAIECATEGATITFDSALTNQTITLTSGEIGIKSNLIIEGLGADHLTISGNNASRIFHIRPGWNLDLNGVTLTNATEPVDGGSILVGGTLTLQNVLLENNFENGVAKGLTMSPGALVTILGNVELIE